MFLNLNGVDGFMMNNSLLNKFHDAKSCMYVNEKHTCNIYSGHHVSVDERI